MAQRTSRPELPPGLVPPAGLDDAKPLLEWAEPAPAPPPGRRALAPTEPLTRALFDDPPQRYRPWTRWWWLGNLVNEDELRREIAQFAEKGFGGVEVQPFSLGDRVDRRPGVRERILQYDTEAFWSNVRAALDAARDAKIEVDLTHGSGWPAGGPWVGLRDTYESLVYGAVEIDGGREVSLTLPQPHVPVGYTITGLLESFFGEVISFPAEHRRLLSVLAARTGDAGDGRAADTPGDASGAAAPANPLRGSVRLDRDSLVVLDRGVENGMLRWQAPGGTWQVIATYAMPAGEAPSLVATPRAGLVLDHFDAAKVRAHYDYLFGRRTGLDRYWGDPLRGFFNDSLEFKVERHWAPGFLEEFERRRGYDLRPWLPALFVAGADNFFVSDVFGVHPSPDFAFGRAASSSDTGDDERVRWDYELTVSELVIERFFDASNEWAAARGLVSRAQGYGMALDAIRAAGSIDIPETEALYAGGSDLFLKLASSGAHQYGRPLVSAEAFVWRGGEYRTTPQKVRAAADKLFTAGVNHVVWHGTPYRVERAESDGYGDEGWYPWALPGASFGFSTNFSEASPFWQDAEAVNRYLARAQLLLRQGRPEADVLVYYPFLRFPSSFGGDADAAAREDLFNGWLPEAEPALSLGSSLARLLPEGVETREDPLMPWLRERQRELLALDQAGLTWEWTNEEGLERARWRDHGIEIGDGRYGALLVASAPWLPVAAAQAVARLAEAGAPVFLRGESPARQPGLFEREAGDATVRDAMARARTAMAAGASDPRDADRDIDDLAASIARRVRPARLVERRGASPTIRHIARALGDDRRRGAIVLVRNAAADEASTELRLPRSPAPALLVDAVSGAIRLAPSTADGWIPIALAARASIFVVAGVPLEPTPAASWPARWLAAPAVIATGTDAASESRNESGAGPRRIDQWDLAVTGDDVDGGRYTRERGPLFDWRDEPRLRLVSSPGRYTSTIDLEAIDPDRRYLLDLGRVLHAADVRVNGERLAVLLFSPFAVDVTAALRPGRNTVEVTVRSPLLNRFIGRGESGDARYAQFAGRPPLATGLLGPVTLRSIAHRR